MKILNDMELKSIYGGEGEGDRKLEVSLNNDHISLSIDLVDFSIGGLVNGTIVIPPDMR